MGGGLGSGVTRSLHAFLPPVSPDGVSDTRAYLDKADSRNSLLCGLPPLSPPQAGIRQASDLPEGDLTVIPIIMWLGAASLVSLLGL